MLDIAGSVLILLRNEFIFVRLFVASLNCVVVYAGYLKLHSARS